jgi:hypothetical protein
VLSRNIEAEINKVTYDVKYCYLQKGKQLTGTGRKGCQRRHNTNSYTINIAVVWDRKRAVSNTQQGNINPEIQR